MVMWGGGSRIKVETKAKDKGTESRDRTQIFGNNGEFKFFT
jgi:hypothetical protein